MVCDPWAEKYYTAQDFKAMQQGEDEELNSFFLPNSSQQTIHHYLTGPLVSDYRVEYQEGLLKESITLEIIEKKESPIL